MCEITISFPQSCRGHVSRPAIGGVLPAQDMLGPEFEVAEFKNVLSPLYNKVIDLKLLDTLAGLKPSFIVRENTNLYRLCNTWTLDRIMQQVSNILPSLLNDNAKTLPIEKRKSVQILLPSAFSAFCGVVYSAAVDAKKANLLILAKANKESKKKLDSVRLALSQLDLLHTLTATARANPKSLPVWDESAPEQKFKVRFMKTYVDPRNMELFLIVNEKGKENTLRVQGCSNLFDLLAPATIETKCIFTFVQTHFALSLKGMTEVVSWQVDFLALIIVDYIFPVPVIFLDLAGSKPPAGAKFTMDIKCWRLSSPPQAPLEPQVLTGGEVTPLCPSDDEKALDVQLQCLISSFPNDGYEDLWALLKRSLRALLERYKMMDVQIFDKVRDLINTGHVWPGREKASEQKSPWRALLVDVGAVLPIVELGTQSEPEANEADSAAIRLFRAYAIFSPLVSTVIQTSLRNFVFPKPEDTDFEEKFKAYFYARIKVDFNIIIEKHPGDTQEAKVERKLLEKTLEASIEKAYANEMMIYKSCDEKNRWFRYCYYAVGNQCRKNLPMDGPWSDFYAISQILSRLTTEILSGLEITDSKQPTQSFAACSDCNKLIDLGTKQNRNLVKGYENICTTCDAKILRRYAKDNVRNLFCHGENFIPNHQAALDGYLYIMRRLNVDESAVAQVEHLKSATVQFEDYKERSRIQDKFEEAKREHAQILRTNELLEEELAKQKEELAKQKQRRKADAAKMTSMTKAAVNGVLVQSDISFPSFENNSVTAENRESRQRVQELSRQNATYQRKILELQTQLREKEREILLLRRQTNPMEQENESCNQELEHKKMNYFLDEQKGKLTMFVCVSMRCVFFVYVYS